MRTKKKEVLPTYSEEPVVDTSETEELNSESSEVEAEELLDLAVMSLKRFNITRDELVGYMNRYGNVYISYIHNPEYSFLWRKLSRAEHKSMLESGAANKKSSYEEAVLRKCLLLPSPSQEFIATSDAGLIPTLYTQIMYQTGFISDEQALANIVEL